MNILKNEFEKLKLDNYILDNRTHVLHPSEIAALLKELEENEFQSYIVQLPKEIMGDVTLQLPDRYFDIVIKSLSIDDLCIAVTELESDDQTDFMQDLEEVDQTIAQAVFNKLDKADQVEILDLKQYTEDQAGAYMQLEVFTAVEDENVHDVIKRFAALREQNELENVQNLFISEKNGKLKYAIGLDDLLVFDFTKNFKEVINSRKESFEPKTALSTEDIHEVVHYFEEFDLRSIPVVNSKGILIGRITSDDVYDIMNKHATEQMYHLAGVDDHAEEDRSVLKAGKKRAFWLAINLITAILASLVISQFQDSLQSLVALAVLMPIVASMGGNAGTQSLTVVVRKLALGDIAKNDAKRTIKKELLIAAGNGMIFSLLMGVIASIWFDTWMLGVVIALSMVVNLLAAGFFGAAVPLILKRFKIDPAIGSTVILTTITDIVGFVSFLGLATVMLL